MENPNSFVCVSPSWHKHLHSSVLKVQFLPTVTRYRDLQHDIPISTTSTFGSKTLTSCLVCLSRPNLVLLLILFRHSHSSCCARISPRLRPSILFQRYPEWHGQVRQPPALPSQHTSIIMHSPPLPPRGPAPQIYRNPRLRT